MGKQIFKEAKKLGVKFGKYSMISLLHLVKNTVLFRNQRTKIVFLKSFEVLNVYGYIF